MSNLSYLVPTKLDNFNYKSISTMLEKEFTEFTFEKSKNEIQIKNNKDALVTTIYFKQSCASLVNYDENIEEIRDRMLEMQETNITENLQNYQELILKLEILKRFSPDLKNCLSLTYGNGIFIEEKFRVERFLMKQFNGYLFDEGIHPEFQTFEEVD